MRFTLFILLIALSIITGCSRTARIDTQQIEGTITLDGSPLPKAIITFCPVSGGEIASAYSDEQGKFVVSSQNGAAGQGAFAGEYAVTVSKIEAKWVSVNSKSDPDAGESITKELLPKTYQDKTKTPLKVSIKQGKNTVQLEVKSK